LPAAPSHTPLIALQALVLDLETTGLNVSTDRIVQIGAIAMSGDTLLDHPRLDQLVNPDMPIPALASRIHGISDADVARAPRYGDLVTRLRELLSGRVIIGHHIGFDLAILRHEAGRAGVPWPEPAMLDVAQVYGALRPAMVNLDLDSIAQSLGIRIGGRHSAIGDCQATAEAWRCIIPLLREVDVRTLGEALALANQRQDLVLRQAQAGWFTRQDETIATGSAEMPPNRIDSYAFERRVSDVMHGPPLMAAPDTTLRDAARHMVEHGVGSLLVGATGSAPIGILTESDLLRAVAGGEAGYFDRAKVTDIMKAPVECMVKSEMLYRALGRMDRLGIRHLCIVDFDGIPVGMISQRDLLHHRSRSLDVLADALQAADGVAGLASAFSRLPEVARGLVFEGLNGVDIARVISTELRALTARAAEMTLANMAAAGRGQPPAPFCLLVLGSGGRGESLLRADQDNALIHAGDTADDAWFAELGEGISVLLDCAGVPFCKGGVMAVNPQWHGTVDEWSDRIKHWLRRADPTDLINVDIFFDLVPVAGDAMLARQLHTEAVRAASGAPAFIGLLAQATQGMSPRLGLFGKPHLEDGRIDLKREGLLPLVNLARTLAIRIASRSRPTPERLRDAAHEGRIGEKDAEQLIQLHQQLLSLVLQQQLRDLEAGVPLSARVVFKNLEREQRRSLQHGLGHLHSVVGEIRSLVSG